MSITKNSNRQTPLVAMVEVSLADIASGVAAAAVELPGGAIVVGGDVTVITPFDSGTTDVIDVGDSGTANRYLNDGNIAAAGRIPLVPTGYVTENIGDINVTVTSVGTAATEGTVRLTVEYVVEGRACSSQG
jgi:hypothetical protein